MVEAGVPVRWTYYLTHPRQNKYAVRRSRSWVFLDAVMLISHTCPIFFKIRKWRY